MPRAFDIPSADGSIDVRLFTPAGAAAPLPAIVLLTDIRSIRPAFDELAQRLAALGYAVLLPNLYHRSVRGPAVTPGETLQDSGVRERLSGYRALLTPDALLRDFTAFVAALEEAPEADAQHIGTVGYCMAGGIALRLAATYPDRVRAVAALHGARMADSGDPNSAHHVAPAIRGMVYLGHAGQDTLAPPEEIGLLDQLLAKAGVRFLTEYYATARHGFAIADAPAYDADASARHFARLTSLFEENLGG